MKTIVPFTRDDDRLEAASRWVLKIDEGGLTTEDIAKLDEWLAAEESNISTLLEVASMWDKSASLARLADLFPLEIQRRDKSHKKDRVHWAQGARAWAIVLGFMVIGVAGLLSLNHSMTARYQDRGDQSAVYQTAVGEHRLVVLADGSEVELNTNSRLSVAFKPDRRLLHLLQREIIVRVVHDKSRPLLVVAADRVVQAVGTEFRVEITDQQNIEVLVTEGKVVVAMVSRLNAAGKGEDKGSMPAFASSPLSDLQGTFVSAGEQVTLRPEAEVKTPVSSDDIEVKLSWREGRLVFRSEPLERALAEVERYTTVEFVFVDDALKARTISGRFKAGDVEALLASLSANFGVSYQFENENRVLLSGR